ncbi:CopY/TcrY family copper transport repressor [Lactobacillus crispatus]|uniref:CopY/TcrY family copper transport repressor n=1 Tax=Lactobacillus crispatus TaxID=47770 RepID=UPI0015E01C0E|nr:CopY/TcrY family copper transport repressor [Lactobacillus crispatus]MDU7064859.1 CopY/TcrY family copper transport repressor [Lactobacillus crispatus]QLK32688.1 CopY/TcrY family copper transport repressor [Lactobacillus crispatus]
MVKLQEKESTISDSEWEIMRIIWTIEPVSSTKIIQELQAKKDWSESTIKTLLRRLVNKNLLNTTKEGRHFVYSAKVNQAQVMTEAAQELLDRMCNMHKGEVILQLLADSPISKNDLAKMKQVINQKEKTAPEMVPCNCLPGKEHLC